MQNTMQMRERETEEDERGGEGKERRGEEERNL